MDEAETKPAIELSGCICEDEQDIKYRIGKDKCNANIKPLVSVTCKDEPAGTFEIQPGSTVSSTCHEFFPKNSDTPTGGNKDRMEDGDFNAYMTPCDFNVEMTTQVSTMSCIKEHEVEPDFMFNIRPEPVEQTDSDHISSQILLKKCEIKCEMDAKDLIPLIYTCEVEHDKVDDIKAGTEVVQYSDFDWSSQVVVKQEQHYSNEDVYVTDPHVGAASHKFEIENTGQGPYLLQGLSPVQTISSSESDSSKLHDAITDEMALRTRKEERMCRVRKKITKTNCFVCGTTHLPVHPRYYGVLCCQPCREFYDLHVMQYDKSKDIYTCTHTGKSAQITVKKHNNCIACRYKRCMTFLPKPETLKWLKLTSNSSSKAKRRKMMQQEMLKMVGTNNTSQTGGDKPHRKRKRSTKKKKVPTATLR